MLNVLLAASILLGGTEFVPVEVPQPDKTCVYLDIEEFNDMTPNQRSGTVISWDCDIVDCARHAKEKCATAGGATETKIVKMWVQLGGIWGWYDVCQWTCKHELETKGAICIEQPKNPPRETAWP